jgi:hypothetical protein
MLGANLSSARKLIGKTHPLLKNAGIAFILAYPLIWGLTSADSGDEASVDLDEYGDDADDSAWNMLVRCGAVWKVDQIVMVTT